MKLAEGNIILTEALNKIQLLTLFSLKAGLFFSYLLWRYFHNSVKKN